MRQYLAGPASLDSVSYTHGHITSLLAKTYRHPAPTNHRDGSIPPITGRSPGMDSLRKAVLGNLIDDRSIEANALTYHNIVCAGGSSLVLTRAAIKAFQATRVLTPEAGYKRLSQHAAKTGSALEYVPINHGTGKIDINTLHNRLTEATEPTVFLFTQPGNPVDPDYTAEELQQLAAVLINSCTPVIIDHAFEGLGRDNYYTPLETIKHNGQTVLCNGAAIYTTSKRFGVNNANRMGSLATSNSGILRGIKQQLPDTLHPSASEWTTSLLEEYGESSLTLLKKNLTLLRQSGLEALERLNTQLEPLADLAELGSDETVILLALSDNTAPHYPYFCLQLHEKVASRLGIISDTNFSSVLEKYGTKTLPLSKTGVTLPHPTLRVDLYPYTDTGSPELSDTTEIFDRIGYALTELAFRADGRGIRD